MKLLDYMLFPNGIYKDPQNVEAVGQHHEASEKFSASLCLQISIDTLYGTTPRSWPLEHLYCGNLPSSLGCQKLKKFWLSQDSIHHHCLLAHTKPSYLFIQETDASNVGEVLSQKQGLEQQVQPGCIRYLQTLSHRVQLWDFRQGATCNQSRLWDLKALSKRSQTSNSGVHWYKKLEYLCVAKSLTQWQLC